MYSLRSAVKRGWQITQSKLFYLIKIKHTNMQSDHQYQELKERATLEIKPFIDANGWIRVLIKDSQQIKLDFAGVLTAEHFTTKFKFKDFGVSDNEETMNTSESWYIENVKLKAYIVNNLPGYPPQYVDSAIICLNEVIANVFNGKTPTGHPWTQEYNQGFLSFSGVIKTYGSWDQFWQGCTAKPYVKIGS
jgi:hypothetical protein